MLIDICRILGTTNRYLAAGGVKGDSHFPWHSLSNLSKIRQDLDVWASGTADVFSSLDSLFGQGDSTVLVLSKLIYHLIHCLVYRPFLPIDLAELAGTGQHQSWQIEATNMCFLHANAIAELVELGKQAASIEWPAFVGYCICTAGTVHIHGAHYTRSGNTGEMSVFSSSAEFLSREMQQLSELCYAWASVQHQRETLQGIFHAHSELIKSLANNPLRYSPAFHLEDFFDRYSNIDGPGGQTFSFDAANLSLSDAIIDFTADSYTGPDLYAPRHGSTDMGSNRPTLKRKNTAPSGRKRPSLPGNLQISSAAGPSALSRPPYPSIQTPSAASQISPGMLHSPMSATPRHDLQGRSGQMAINDALAPSTPMVSATPTFPSGPQTHTPTTNIGQELSGLPATGFSPSFNFSQLRPATPGPSNTQQGYDPMFGGFPTNAFSSPAPWHGADEGGGGGGKAPGGVSPGSRSHNDGAASGPTEEKDPFLSLLEQLAENESAMGTGNELDFFLARAPSGS